MVIESQFTGRQQAPEVYDVNASIYVIRRAFLVDNPDPILWHSKFGVSVMMDTGIIDIDSEHDYLLMEAIAQHLYAHYPEFNAVRENIRADALFDRALELVMDAGQTLLENGGEVFRAQQTMEIMAASLGVRDFHVYVLTNGIFASAHLPGRDAVSLVRHVPTVSVHLGRVEAVNELSRELAAGRLGVVEAEARLNTARTLPRSTPQLEILACVVGAAGFAYLFGGTLADMPVAAVAGLLEALVCQQFARHGINRIFTDIVAAFCGTIWAIAVQTVVPAVNANAAIIGALMVLTPGVALTMGVRDILNGDYLSGSIRLLDALLIAGSIAGGVVLGWIMARGLGVA